MTYRAPDEERVQGAAAEREAAEWIGTIEEAQLVRRRYVIVGRRSWRAWGAIVAGPFLGALAAWVVAALRRVPDPSAIVVIGGFAGFAFGVGVAVRLAVARSQTLR